MRNLVFRMGKRFSNGKTVIDLGSSLGRSFEMFLNNGYNIISCEISKPMFDRQIELFGNNKNVDIRNVDFVSDFPSENVDIITSILTIQFTPIEDRQKIVKNIFDHLNDDGVFILVEKIIGQNYEIDDGITCEYYADKYINGYSKDAILDKKKSLSGVLIPVTESWNIDMLKNAGFKHVECFWRDLNFCGFIALKR